MTKAAVGTGLGAASQPRGTLSVAEDQLVVAEFGDDPQAPAKSAHVGAKCGYLDVAEVPRLELADAGLAYAHCRGDLFLGQVAVAANLGETEGADLFVEVLAVCADLVLVQVCVRVPHARSWLPSPVTSSLLVLGLGRSLLRQVLVVAVVGDRDIVAVPLLPVAGLVAGNKQDRLPGRVEGEQDPDLGGATRS